MLAIGDNYNTYNGALTNVHYGVKGCNGKDVNDYNNGNGGEGHVYNRDGKGESESEDYSSRVELARGVDHRCSSSNNLLNLSIDEIVNLSLGSSSSVMSSSWLSFNVYSNDNCGEGQRESESEDYSSRGELARGADHSCSSSDDSEDQDVNDNNLFGNHDQEYEVRLSDLLASMSLILT